MPNSKMQTRYMNGIALLTRQSAGLVVLFGLLSLTPCPGQTTATPPKQGAELLKTDLMGIFAHPDDETGVGATLAFYALGRGSVVADVYCTRGEGGGNMVGTQSGPALGELREAELRDSLSTLGVRYCYFLDRLDWAYTESLSATFQKWGKEQTLERLVRLVRLLRPEVIVTMNPAPTPGQHGHHQAAGVLATEAFTAAADQNRFSAQLKKEGLSVWQPKRLFYAGGDGDSVTTITVNQPLPNGKTPGSTAGEAMANHRSQAFGNPSNAPWLERPQKFTLVKAFVEGTPATDLFDGLPSREVQRTAIALRPRTTHAVVLEFVPRPAIARYRQWLKEQDIEQVGVRFQNDLPMITGDANSARIRLFNNGSAPIEGDMRIEAPVGWRVEPPVRHLSVPAGNHAEIPLRVTVPRIALGDGKLRGVFTAGSSEADAEMKIHILPRCVAVRLAKAPTLDGSDSGWENVLQQAITPKDLVQGKVTDEVDNSAVFRVAHDGKTLYVDVQVRDDVVVSNIAPNDIRGHWRSDSVEICLDPIGGAEHTMNCYKLGIFPFDTTGTVRGARDADANQGPIEETAPKTRLVSKRTQQGYRIQAAIPFEEIRLSPAAKQLGFNIIIYDGDKANAAIGENINKSRIAWAPCPGVQGRPEDWGRLDLQ